MEIGKVGNLFFCVKIRLLNLSKAKAKSASWYKNKAVSMP